MIDTSPRSLRRQPRPATGVATLAFCAALAVLGGTVPAMAGPKDQAAPADSHYQIYIGGRDSGAYMLGRDMGELRFTPPTAGASSMTYFTPSVSGVRVGVGFTVPPPAGSGTESAAQYTNLGPRTAQVRHPEGKRQVGGILEYSRLEVGANIGDHRDPTCTGGGCKTNDFWDIGVALRIGSGAISAGYTASQPRGPRADEVDRIDIYSLNAGYRLTPGMDIYGGVDWVDSRNPSESAEIPVDTRFMLGTNLRF